MTGQAAGRGTVNSEGALSPPDTRLLGGEVKDDGDHVAELSERH